MFEYLIEKIKAAPLQPQPFPHIHIPQLFTAEHFHALTCLPEIALRPCRSDGQLLEALREAGFRVIDFPGCMTDVKAYRRRRTRGGADQVAPHMLAGESGMAFRLEQPRSPILATLLQFLASTPFLEALASRFDVDLGASVYDGGIQKYLDGYQISPHPDVRRKALTWMANVVPDPDCERRDYHTQYMRLRPEFAYVRAYWDGNPGVERCHLPWDAAECDWVQRANNSFVAFAPGNDTLHAVKAWYDHLPAQRTQIYGNLWERGASPLPIAEWPALAICPKVASQPLRARVAAHAPAWLRDTVGILRARRRSKGILRRNTSDGL